MNFQFETPTSPGKAPGGSRGLGGMIGDMRLKSISGLFRHEPHIQFDLSNIGQADGTVAQLVEETCLKYPSIRLMGIPR